MKSRNMRAVKSIAATATVRQGFISRSASRRRTATPRATGPTTTKGVIP